MIWMTTARLTIVMSVEYGMVMEQQPGMLIEMETDWEMRQRSVRAVMVQ